MQARLAQRHAQAERDAASRSKEDRRSIVRETGAVGRDEHVSRKRPFFGPTELAQSRRADLFAGLKEPFHIASQPARADIEHRLQGRQIDRVLPLIVRRSPPVPTITINRQTPWTETRSPCLLLAVNHIAVAIKQYCRQQIILVSFCDQKGGAGVEGVFNNSAGEAQPLQCRGHFPGQIIPECFRAIVRLAFSSQPNTTVDRFLKRAKLYGVSCHIDGQLAQPRWWEHSPPPVMFCSCFADPSLTFPKHFAPGLIFIITESHVRPERRCRPSPLRAQARPEAHRLSR